MGTMARVARVVMFASTLRALGVNRVVTTLLASRWRRTSFLPDGGGRAVEPVLVFFLLASLRAYVSAAQPAAINGDVRRLVCAGAMMCRYEAAFWTAAMAAR
jgi:hypothetical protein